MELIRTKVNLNAANDNKVLAVGKVRSKNQKLLAMKRKEKKRKQEEEEEEWYPEIPSFLIKHMEERRRLYGHL